MRFLFYSHDGLGLGHTRRHFAVATALASRTSDATILLATGAEEFLRYGLPRQVEILKLPGLRKDANGKYSSRRLPTPASEIRSLRSELLRTAVKSFRPDVVLVDKHPFGAGGEFKAGLKELRKAGGYSVLGLRDILDEPTQVLREWQPFKMQKKIAEYYDQVVIYGDRTIFDAITAYKFPSALADKTQYVGYVFNPEHELALENFNRPFPPRDQRDRPVVLAATGGGEDGVRTIENFIRAAAGAPWLACVVFGPMFPDAQLPVIQRLAAENGVRYRNYVPHLSALFREVDALVSMGGYNTLVEAAALGLPTVCIPRIEPRAEQLIRAEAFGKLGLLQVMHPNELGPELLRHKISLILKVNREQLREHSRATLRLDGASRAADLLLTLATSRAARNPVET
jgi:predicted glycosyltransferase